MKIKNQNKSKIKSSSHTKESLLAQPLTQAQLISKINAHTRFTRQLTQTFINQSDTALCRSEKEKHGR